MRIGINLIALPSEKGSGAFRYFQMMMEAMRRYNLIDIDFVVYKQRQISEEYLGLPPEFKVTYVNVPKVGSGLKRVLFEQTFFYYYIKPCDVLYSYCTSLPIFVKAKKIFTLHDVYYLTEPKRYGKLQRTYLTLITKLYVKACDTVLTVSDFSYSEIRKYLGVPSEKLRITYNFIFPSNKSLLDIEEITDVKGNVIDLDIPFFLYIGNLQPGKNIEGMINGYNIFRRKSGKTQLLIVGKPTTFGNKVLESVKGEEVHYLGYRKREEVEYLLSTCKAVVLLSFCEGFGIPPLEGFGYGKPALVSNRTSLPEVAGDAGCVVDPYDLNDISEGFMSILLDDSRYIKNISSQLEKFDYHKSVQVFMDSLGIVYSSK